MYCGGSKRWYFAGNYRKNAERPDANIQNRKTGRWHIAGVRSVDIKREELRGPFPGYAALCKQLSGSHDGGEQMASQIPFWYEVL